MEYRIEETEAGRSLRDILRNSMYLSDGAIRRAVWGRRILLNDREGHLCDPVKAGDIVRYAEAENTPAYQPKPLNIDLNIPWRSNRLMIIDKPAPLASQSGRGHPDDSLENAVFGFLGCPDRFIYRPVNRLDKGTSGLMAVALTGEEQARLQKLLHTAAFQRIYLAVTDGVPPSESGTVDFPIAKADSATIRRIVSPQGRRCVTHYQVIRVNGSRALVRLWLETGRTHQIRVHLAALGCPVYGDFLYGQESPALPGRFALHSSELTFPDITGEAVHVTSPLPPALEALL